MKLHSLKKIAVLGSNPFSGSHCVDYFLANSPARVIGISRSPQPPRAFLPYRYQKPKPDNFSFYQCDINKDSKRIEHILDKEKPALIVNFLAQSNAQHSWDRPVDWFETNAVGMVRLLDILRKKAYLKKYIHISTPEIYGDCHDFEENLTYYNPTNPYAASKGAADLFLNALWKRFHFPVCFVRSANVYGPHQQPYRLIPKAIVLLERGEKFPLHNGGGFRRSFVHIRDLMGGVGRIVERGRLGELYHFSDTPTTIKKIVQLVCKKMNRPFAESVVVSSVRPNQDRGYELNIDKAKRELGWQPRVSLAEGIDETIRWIRDNWHAVSQQPLEYIHRK